MREHLIGASHRKTLGCEQGEASTDAVMNCRLAGRSVKGISERPNPVGMHERGCRSWCELSWLHVSTSHEARSPPTHARCSGSLGQTGRRGAIVSFGRHKTADVAVQGVQSRLSPQPRAGTTSQCIFSRTWWSGLEELSESGGAHSLSS